MTLAAIICQCAEFDDMERFAKLKEGWLRKFLKLRNGTPSNDTFRRVFSSINPKQFNRCFMIFIEAQHGELAKQLIAIDGKAMGHSFDRGTGAEHMHLLNAWTCELNSSDSTGASKTNATGFWMSLGRKLQEFAKTMRQKTWHCCAN